MNFLTIRHERSHIREWPPGLPVFGQITPFPATPLYNRLLKDGCLTRPTHWLDFGPFEMAHTPLKMSVAVVHEEIKYAWTNTHSPENTWSAMRKIDGVPAAYQLSHLIARLCFHGIYFPQKGSGAWFKVVLENRRIIFRIVVNCLSNRKDSGIPVPLALPKHSDLTRTVSEECGSVCNPSKSESDQPCRQPARP